MSFGDDTLDPVTTDQPIEQRKRDALSHIYNAARAVLQEGGQSQNMRTLEDCCKDYQQLLKEVPNDTPKST
jgi:hypothetical protein